jgi:hypothetical protein
MRLKALSCVVAAVGLAAISVPANAEFIQAAWEGDVYAAYIGSNSPFDWTLGLKVNGTEYPTKGLSTFTSNEGDELWFGHVLAGDSLVWFVERADNGRRLYSDTPTNWGLGFSTARGFGNNRNGFTDYVFSFGIAPNSGADAGAVPEPASWAMMIAGFGMLGAVARRRQRTSLSVAAA